MSSQTSPSKTMDWSTFITPPREPKKSWYSVLLYSQDHNKISTLKLKTQERDPLVYQGKSQETLTKLGSYGENPHQLSSPATLEGKRVKPLSQRWVFRALIWRQVQLLLSSITANLHENADNCLEVSGSSIHSVIHPFF